MIAEPYICIKGKPQGEIRWYQEGCPSKQDPDIGYWRPYADFEREKLKELKAKDGISRGNWGYCIRGEEDRFFGMAYNSKDMGYSGGEYEKDSESSRLLKRAEFLKAVCEKEGIEWLPKANSQKLCMCAGESDIRSRNGRCGNCGLLEKPLAARSIITQAGYEAAVEKAQDCPYSCPRAAKLESRLAQHYYAKHEIDERISALINHSDMPEDTKRALRTRFL